MDVAKQESEEFTPQQETLADLTQCCLCGTELKFRHTFNYAYHLVREDAHCPCCQIQLRTREHVIH